jgi:hypothetical protein
MVDLVFFFFGIGLIFTRFCMCSGSPNGETWFLLVIRVLLDFVFYSTRGYNVGYLLTESLFFSHVVF